MRPNHVYIRRQFRPTYLSNGYTLDLPLYIMDILRPTYVNSGQTVCQVSRGHLCFVWIGLDKVHDLQGGLFHSVTVVLQFLGLTGLFDFRHDRVVECDQHLPLGLCDGPKYIQGQNVGGPLPYC